MCTKTLQSTPPIAPDRPLKTSVTGGRINVQWSVPGDSGGIKVSGFRLLASKQGQPPANIYEEPSKFQFDPWNNLRTQRFSVETHVYTLIYWFWWGEVNSKYQI
jgi:hypothetical protein